MKSVPYRYISMASKYTETVFSSQNKKGVLTPDENGYYTVVLGGLNTYNSAGEFYTAGKAEAIFENSSSFQRRVQGGALYAELGHPKKAPGMSLDEYYRRVLSIEETNICAHISEVWLDPDFGRKNPQRDNPNIIAIMGKIKPTGPHAEVVKTAFENPKQNPAFSIRSITDNEMVGGRMEKTLSTIITFDYVLEPGIAIAKKSENPSMEDNSISYLVKDEISHTINKNVMQRVISEQLKYASMESNTRSIIDDVTKSLRIQAKNERSFLDW